MISITRKSFILFEKVVKIQIYKDVSVENFNEFAYFNCFSQTLSFPLNPFY